MRIGVYICHCGSNIAGVIPPAEVAEWASHLPGVVRATWIRFMPARIAVKPSLKKISRNTT